MSIDLQWFDDQVGKYTKIEPRYARYAGTLRDVLEAAARKIAPHAIVQVRPKGIASFAEKILRKRDKYADPVNQLTDLCGARVIAHTRAEVEAICAFIRSHFEIDEENSLDSADRLRANEFGYRSVHYIVQFVPGGFDLRLMSPLNDSSGLQAEGKNLFLVAAVKDVLHFRIFDADGELVADT